MKTETERPLSEAPQKDGTETNYNCGLIVTGGWATRIEAHKTFCKSAIGQFILKSEKDFSSLLQERDTLKQTNERQQKLITIQKETLISQNNELAEIEAHYSSVGMGLYPKEIYKERDQLREANKELIEALTEAKDLFDRKDEFIIRYDCTESDWLKSLLKVIESALLKHRKGE